MNQPIIDISIQHSEWTRAIRDIQNIVISVIGLTLEKADVEAQGKELSLVLADNDFVQALNKEWRGKDKPTNVLSFPQDEPMLLGDIILAYETVRDEAKEQDKRFEDHATHLIVHGLLHLLGHDHIEEADAQIMESLEIEILRTLNIKNPYDHESFVA
ncbi:MAG TPA: rRNA maturation RNase YbeY [Alphaproteobacteria bacterium]|nr:MAG: rRNA maturation RNase YbeY [Rhodospirillales bacterium]HOO81987.1 rRNA maturation RNase YbeY [Alphaproteobacteria bacterium]